MLRTGTHPVPETIVQFDPNAMTEAGGPWPMPQLKSVSRWAVHQAFQEMRRPQAARNQNPMEHLGKASVGLLSEMTYFSQVWPQPFALDALRAIAAGELCPTSKTRVTIPEITFTQRRPEAVQHAAWLNETAQSAQIDMQVTIAEDVYHSATDDPAVCAQYIREALAGTG